MTLSFLAFRWRFRGMEPDPGPFGPQHGITWTIARPARWHGHLQSLRNIIEGIPDQSYHLPQRAGHAQRPVTRQTRSWLHSRTLGLMGVAVAAY